MAKMSTAKTDRTICQRSASRWSTKLISASSSSRFPLMRLKNDFLCDSIANAQKIKVANLIKTADIYPGVFILLKVSMEAGETTVWKPRGNTS